MWKILLIVLGVAMSAAVVAVAIANVRFDRRVDREIEAMRERASAEARFVTPEDLDGLPAPVRRWLNGAGVVGKAIPAAVQLRQEGEIRLGPGPSWMSFTADQHYTIDPVGFIWRVSAIAAPGIFIRGVDSLREGHGAMQMKPLALFAVVDASGPTLDQGSGLRYLQETVWFPFAALSRHIVWEAIDDSSARATLSLDGLEVSGTFYFDSDGRVIDFEALRYRDEQPQPTMRTWRTPLGEHATFGGILVPTAGEGVWSLDNGDFTYIRLRVLELKYDAVGAPKR